MAPDTHAQPLPADAEELARRWSRRDGSLLLRDADDPGRKHLYFAPRWTLRMHDGQLPEWSGAVPSSGPRLDSPLAWPWLLTCGWSSAASPCGLAGYLAYDAHLGPSMRHERPAGFDVPDAWWGLYDAVLTFGEATAELHVADLSAVHAGPKLPLLELWENRAAELTGVAPTADATSDSASDTEFLDPRWHRESVERIQRALRAGDAYQVNLTGHVRVRSARDPYEHFLTEQARNPASHAAYLNVGNAIVASHSPERLLRLRGRELRTSPIKGTAAEAGAKLMENEKNRAEHIMIVDLCRNDLGRVSRFGSVRVSSLMHRLRLRGLEHLQSHVDSELDLRRRDHLFRALFPGGSITGAPKLRAMELIREVEQHRRGVYTGSIGVIRCDGRAEWNIAIRTSVWQDGVCWFGCGGGIVIDSDPAAEYAEAHLKARSFLESLNASPALSEAIRR